MPAWFFAFRRRQGATYPVVNVALIVANFAAWLFHELPNLDSAVTHASFYLAPSTTPATPQSRGASADPDGDDAGVRQRHRRANTEPGGQRRHRRSVGAYFVLYPGSRITTWAFFFIVRIPTWIYFGGWFLYQLLEANFGLFGTEGTAAV